MRFYLPILLTALATAVYHISQESIAPGANPVVSLVMPYLTALLVPLAALPLSPGGSGSAARAVGASIVAVELGVLLAYRAGWRISLASVVATVTTAVLLVGVGVLFYREQLAPKRVAGLLLCLAGLLMVAQR